MTVITSSRVLMIAPVQSRARAVELKVYSNHKASNPILDKLGTLNPQRCWRWGILAPFMGTINHTVLLYKNNLLTGTPALFAPNASDT